MKDQRKTKAQLIDELNQLRQRVAELEAAAAGCQDGDHLYREMVEHANDIIYTLSPEGVLTFVSPNWTEILGHDRSEVIGVNFVPFVHPDDIERCGAFLQRVFETGERQGPIEYRVQRKDGEYRCHTSNAALLDAPDGSKTYVGIARDITERKQAEDALRDSEAMLSSVLDNSGTVIFIKDLEGKYLLINRRYEDLFHISREEVVGKTDFDIFPAEAAEQFQEKDRRALEHGPIEEEELVPQDDGPHTYVSVKFPLLDAAGEAYATCGIATDITGRKRDEQALQRAHDELERRVEERTREIKDSERKFRALADGTPAGIAITQDDRFLYANKATVERSGRSWEELSKMVPFDTLCESAQRAGGEALQEAMKRGEDQFRFEFLDPDGAWFEVNASRTEIDGQDATIWTSFDVTNRKQAEAALEASEQMFRSLTESVRAMIFIVGLQQPRLIYANPAAVEGTGYSLDELMSDPPPELLAPQSQQLVEAARAGYFNGEELPASMELKFITKSGEERWYESTGALFKTDQGLAKVTVNFDITERKQAQEALEESERRFRGLAESTTAHIAIMQEDRYVYVNQAFLDYYDIDTETLQLVTPEDMMMGNLGPEVMAQAEPAWRAATERGEDSFRFEYKDLEDSWFQAIVTMMELDGKPAFMSTTYDITEHKRAQEEIAESARRYRTIFDTAGTGMISFGDDSVITLANEEWTKLTGYSIDETVGKMTWVPFFTEDSLTKMKQYHQQRGEDPTSAPRSYEAQLVDRAGKVHDGIVNIQLVPGTRQRVASFHDLTELKRAQQQMYRADKMAALGQIIAGVAHEINNPNNFIYFNLPILKRYIEAIAPLLELRLEDEPELKILNMPYEVFLQDVFKLLENMEHGSQRITSIVSDLKSYVRNDEEQVRKPEQLAQALERVMTLVGKQVRKMVKRFDVEVADALPPVKINMGKIEQVLINLLINAGQAADKEQSWVKVSARPAQGVEGWVELLVEDNGAGIPEESLQQIFEPFYTSKGRDQGTGLGLSISHRIIEEHGGTLSVDSTLGEGSCFTVLLPVASS